MDVSIDVYKEAEGWLIETLGLENFASQAERYYNYNRSLRIWKNKLKNANTSKNIEGLQVL